MTNQAVIRLRESEHRPRFEMSITPGDDGYTGIMLGLFPRDGHGFVGAALDINLGMSQSDLDSVIESIHQGEYEGSARLIGSILSVVRDQVCDQIKRDSHLQGVVLTQAEARTDLALLVACNGMVEVLVDAVRRPRQAYPADLTALIESYGTQILSDSASLIQLFYEELANETVVLTRAEALILANSVFSGTRKAFAAFGFE